jgi:acyl carrier protein
MGLDGVELVLAIEETFGVSIPDSDTAELITPGLLIAHVQRLVSSKPKTRPCMSQRAFHKVRSLLVQVTGAGRREIRLDVRIDRLFPKETRQQQWDHFRSISGMTDLPDLRFGRVNLFWPTTVGYLVGMQVGEMQKVCRLTGDWTDQEVRSTISEIICDQLGIKDFNDDDEFIRDLGVD